MAVFEPVSDSAVHDAIPGKAHRSGPWLVVAAIAVLAIVLMGIVAYAERPVPTPACGVRCPPPPPPGLPTGGNTRAPTRGTGASGPVHLSLYQSSTYGFTFQWDPAMWPGSPEESSTNALWPLQDRSGHDIIFLVQGQSANGDAPSAILDSFASSKFPDFHRVYDLPHPQVGYVDGAGTVFDGTLTPASGSAYHARAAVETSVRSGVAVLVVEQGPFDKDTGQGFANPAELVADGMVDVIANTVTWRGEPLP